MKSLCIIMCDLEGIGKHQKTEEDVRGDEAIRRHDKAEESSIL